MKEDLHKKNQGLRKSFTTHAQKMMNLADAENSSGDEFATDLTENQNHSVSPSKSIHFKDSPFKNMSKALTLKMRKSSLKK